MATSLIEMPGGTQENPIYLTVANLARLGDAQLAAALAWVDQERAKRAAYVAKEEAKAKVIAAEQIKRREAQHALNEERSKKPATLGDVR